MEWLQEFMCAMEKAMAPHYSTLAWKIPWTEEPGRLQSMGSLRVGRDSVTSNMSETVIGRTGKKMINALQILVDIRITWLSLSHI